MIDRKQGGSIVQISSMSSTVAMPGQLLYAASKAAVDQMVGASSGGTFCLNDVT